MSKPYTAKAVSRIVYCGRLLLVLAAAIPAPAQAQSPLSALDCVREALTRNPDIQMAMATVLTRTADRTIAESEFDLKTGAEAGYRVDRTPFVSPLGATSSDLSQVDYTLKAQQRTAFGVDLEASAGAQRTLVSSSFVTDGVPQYQATVQLVVRAPLLRNRGMIEQNTAIERTDLLQQAETLTLEASINQQIFDVTRAYWQLWTSEQMLDLAKRSLARSDKTLEETREIVQKGFAPNSDLDILAAHVLQRKSSVYDQELAVYKARLNVARTVGLQFDRAADISGVDLRQAITGVAAATPQIASLAAYSVARRPDYRAYLLQEQAVDLSLSVSDNRLLPQTDLSFSVGYAGVENTTTYGALLTSFGTNTTRPNVSLRLSYSFPVQNRAAQADLQRTMAEKERIRIQKLNAQRLIELDVAAYVASFAALQKRLELAKSEIELSKQAFENERAKIQFGASTLTQVEALEEELLAAEQREVQIVAEIANTVSALRWVSSSFGELRNGEFVIDDTSLFSLPQPR